MAYYYLYSPFSGTSRAQYCYCDAITYRCWDISEACTSRQKYSNCHLCDDPNGTKCNRHDPGFASPACCPLDIATGGVDKDVWLITSSNIKSALINLTTLSCAQEPPPGYSWVKHALKIDLYTDYNLGGTKIATVHFAHIRNRIAAGTYNLPLQPRLGNTGSDNCNCNCYQGIHLHQARTSSYSGYTIPRNCGIQIYTYDYIYRWTL